MDKIADCPKYLPADNPARIKRDQTILSMAAAGSPQRQIARQTGLSPGHISCLLSDEDAKAKLDSLVKMHIAASDKIHTQLINMAKGKQVDDQGAQITHPETDKPIFLSPSDQLKAIQEHDKIIGVAGAHTSNVYIGRLYQDNRSVELSDNMLSVIKRLEDDNIIDIEVPD
jgi:transcriptional regulator with XRE-family HTH domain